MLIACMPKTASTSLIYTLNECTKLNIRPFVEEEGWDANTKDFKEMSKYHKNVYLKTYNFINSMAADKETIYRDHVLPEGEGLRFLRKTRGKIVLLYRRPDHIYDNYARTARNVKPELLKELKIMYERYLEFLPKSNFLFVSYRELALKGAFTVNKICNFLKIKPVKYTALQKRKFTGKGVQRL